MRPINNMFAHAFSILTIAFLLSPSQVRAEDTRFTGPWNLKALKGKPKLTWVDKTGPLGQLYYESEPLGGKPTRVFAYCAFPDKAEGKLPAMVLVHGGGGKAFSEWANLWAKRGYVAFAMDLAGHGPDGKRLADGGPEQDDASKFPRVKTDLKTMWSYHAVAAVIRAHSLLRSLPEVDPERIGLTGISWGGYLTCIVAGLDDRFKVAVPVYGCGFLHDNSVWVPTFAKLPDDWRREWVANFDPSKYPKQAAMPMLFVNGTNDFAYPLDSYQKSYRLVKDRTLCVTVNMPHSHPHGWAPVEIGLFVAQHLRGGKPLARIRTVTRNGRQVEVKFRTEAPLIRAALHYTTDTGPWQNRRWNTQEIKLSGDIARAELPTSRPLVYFLTLTDERKATISTEHEYLRE